MWTEAVLKNLDIDLIQQFGPRGGKKGKSPNAKKLGLVSAHEALNDSKSMVEDSNRRLSNER